MMRYRVFLRSAMGIIAVPSMALVVSGQVLPCWKTVDTGQTACEVWENENPLLACWSNFTLNDPLKRATRDEVPWSQPIIQYAECAGPYRIRNQQGECVVDQNLSGWQTTGTQGGGNPCPGGPPR